MTEEIKRKNLMAKEGRRHADGKPGEVVTAEEWLFLYYQIEDDLEGVQAKLFAGYESSILNRHPKLAMEMVAL